jgi:hypothetical protein
MPTIIRFRRNLTGTAQPIPVTGGEGEPFFATGGFTAMPAHVPGRNELGIWDGTRFAPLVSATRQVELAGKQTITGVKEFRSPVYFYDAFNVSILSRDQLDGIGAYIHAGHATGTGQYAHGGILSLKSGNSTYRDGGTVSIMAGSGAAADKVDGGDVLIMGGNGGLGGPVSIHGGDSSFGEGGRITFHAGTGTFSGGHITFTAGRGSSGLADGTDHGTIALFELQTFPTNTVDTLWNNNGVVNIGSGSTAADAALEARIAALEAADTALEARVAALEAAVAALGG